jgi:hypothetical protein
MAAVADEERAELLGDDEIPGRSPQGWCRRTFGEPVTLAVDIVASIPFYWFMFDGEIPDEYWHPRIYGILFLIVLVGWRLYRAYGIPQDEEASDRTPYTCGIVKSNGKVMFLVATIHISPKSPKDVEDVIESCNCDTVMIELDDERLDKMRAPDAPKEKKPKPEDLQAIEISQEGEKPYKIYAQRSLWNAERAGDTISGPLAFDKDNLYGLERSKGNVQGKLCLVQRGGPEGEFAPFAFKAHMAARDGAEAVLYMGKDDNLPMSRIGQASLWGDVKTAFKSTSCGFPPIPGMLVTQSDSEQLLKAIEAGTAVSAKLEVLNDSYPRRTLRRRLCQSCALVFSGIGILYGVIQCFAVEVGGEFLAAEISANKMGIPCACIDSDINRFWEQLRDALCCSPQNLLDALLAWLAFPRILFQALFPPRGNIDVIGSIFLHAKSFAFRTWFAFILAGWAASTVTSHILTALSDGAERGAEMTGAVKKEDRYAAQTYIALILQLYMLPRVYYAVAATRDLVMYRSLLAKSRENASSRMVVVVGAGHANGIIKLARTHGL